MSGRARDILIVYNRLTTAAPQGLVRCRVERQRISMHRVEMPVGGKICPKRGRNYSAGTTTFTINLEESLCAHRIPIENCKVLQSKIPIWNADRKVYEVNTSHALWTLCGLCVNILEIQCRPMD
ncbi:hypothetical protein Pelo_2935 [Pelomyxa schiedti]|nr:hypothetical protein Pelo_2935 [Pelomyxa schiedti]